MKLKYSEIIRNQPTINIGVIGHVAHGKSTFTKSMTGVKTQKFSSEQERNITIHIGYANTKIFMDRKGHLHTTESGIETLKDEDGNDMILVKHISFVDCPGHETYMANMISGSAIMDTCVLVIASNDQIPQPQTYEHLQAVESVDISEFLVIQNKMDLIKEEENELKCNQLKKFIKGTKAENSRIIPSSIQNDINKDEVLKSLVKLPNIDRKLNDLDGAARMIIIRSFDINKSHTSYENLSGGVVGGSLISGILKVGDVVELRPGFIEKKSEREDGSIDFKFTPIVTTIKSLQSDTSKMEYALPGGLIGICLDIDPSLTKSNRMIGQMIGYIGTLPKVYSALKLTYEELNRFDKLDDGFKLNDKILISVNSMNIKATVLVVKKKKKYIKIQLDTPICVNDSQKVAIFKNINGRWVLSAKSVIDEGVECELSDSSGKYHDILSNNEYKSQDIEIEYDIPKSNFSYLEYDEMLNNIEFKSDITFNMKVLPPQIKVINKETIFSNFESVCDSLKLSEVSTDINYKILMNNYINKELSCSSQEANGTLVVKGKFKNKIFETVISKFVKKYLKCFSCNSYKCYLLRENRKYFRKCLSCGSKSCVDTEN